jgi:hypothetical protein
MEANVDGLVLRNSQLENSRQPVGRILNLRGEAGNTPGSFVASVTGAGTGFLAGVYNGSIAVTSPGAKLALMNGSALQKGFVPLTGGSMAAYNSSEALPQTVERVERSYLN